MKIRIRHVVNICPYCPLETGLFWSHRRGKYEWLISFLNVPWRCRQCGKRFFKLRESDRGVFDGVGAKKKSAVAHPVDSDRRPPYSQDHLSSGQTAQERQNGDRLRRL